MLKKISNIYQLGVKELWSLVRDPIMLVLIGFTFTVSVYTSATAVPDGLQNASIAFVDEDHSALSNRLNMAFYPPHFTHPHNINLYEMDAGMDRGKYTFALNIPANFQRDLLANKQPALQLNIDSTRISQAFSGNVIISQILNEEIQEFLNKRKEKPSYPVNLNERMRFNPNLTQAWFGSLIEVVNLITLISIILTGAALIRERERGTIEHLLVMPLTPAEIMLSKVWSMGLVVLAASMLSLTFVVQGILKVPVAGSVTLFMLGTILHLFATTSMGIYLATLARNMPQFGMLMILVLIPLQLLSGGMTPRESMPELVQNIMLIAPTTHFVEIGQAILFRGAGFSIVWKPFLALFIIGAFLFAFSLKRFRNTIGKMA